MTPGAHAVLIVDGAGWYQTGDKLRVPGNVTLLYLPPYSPELNPVETIWATLCGNKLSNRIFDTYDAIVDACADAWTWFAVQPGWGYLHIELLFVPESARGQGLGQTLMRQAEEEAARRGCHSVWLDTFSFQARV